MNTMFQDVAEFHAKFDLPVAEIEGGTQPCALPSKELIQYRVNFLREELTELVEACDRGDIVEAADAIADLVWVACGTAHYMGIPLDQVWHEVRRSNMEKRAWQEGDPIKPRAAHLTSMGPEIVKPAGWRPPDVVGVLKSVQAIMDGAHL